MPEEKINLKQFFDTIDEAAQKGIEQGINLTNARNERKKQIAIRIKEIRTANQMTQEELSEKININVLTYRGYENKKSEVPIEVLIRIADIFNVSMDYLTCRTDNKLGLYQTIDASKNNFEERLNKLEQTMKNLKNAVE